MAISCNIIRHSLHYSPFSAIQFDIPSTACSQTLCTSSFSKLRLYFGPWFVEGLTVGTRCTRNAVCLYSRAIFYQKLVTPSVLVTTRGHSSQKCLKIALFQGHTTFFLVFHNSLHDTIFRTGRVQTESYTQFYVIKTFHNKFPFVLVSMHNDTNSMIIILLEKLTVAQLLGKYLNYDRIRSSIAVFTKAHPALTHISLFHDFKHSPCSEYSMFSFG